MKGPLGIHDKKDIIRYRNLQRMGLVNGVGVRCVSLTKEGIAALAVGAYGPTQLEPPTGYLLLSRDEALYVPF